MFLPKQIVIGFPVAAASFQEQADMILKWANQKLSKTVCVANVHMLIEGTQKPDFAKVLHSADLLTPDGMPLVWVMKLLRGQPQDRVAGMELMLSLCQKAQTQNIGVFFVGSTPEILSRIKMRLEQDFPGLTVSGMEALPFRPLTPEEDITLIRQIHASGAGIVMVSLGCPKQEIWMYDHKERIQAVMLGLGGAFPVYAGVQKWAPLWVRQAGCEWLYRLLQEPKRLWKRYAVTIPPFVALACQQVIKTRIKIMLGIPMNEQPIETPSRHTA
jgi:N-acetylglucosaminyldiphosphoundecaprenol N-acetyl-beta-D-mannosaminyltransferase